jgi:hypothetical protein|tara:strand:+ start:205 stop:402 length:198 start_codon:yes stop_codon:yes gene_type:complete
MYPATITQRVAKITPKNIKEGMIGSLGKVVDEVLVFSEFISLDMFISMFFTLEVTDSDVVSIFIL